MATNVPIGRVALWSTGMDSTLTNKGGIVGKTWDGRWCRASAPVLMRTLLSLLHHAVVIILLVAPQSPAFFRATAAVFWLIVFDAAVPLPSPSALFSLVIAVGYFLCIAQYVFEAVTAPTWLTFTTTALLGGAPMALFANAMHIVIHATEKSATGHALIRAITELARFGIEPPIVRDHFEVHHDASSGSKGMTDEDPDLSDFDTSTYAFLQTRMHYPHRALSAAGFVLLGCWLPLVGHTLMAAHLAMLSGDMVAHTGVYILHYGWKGEQRYKATSRKVPHWVRSSNHRGASGTLGLSLHADHHRFPRRDPSLLKPMVHHSVQLEYPFLISVFAALLFPEASRQRRKTWHKMELARLGIEQVPPAGLAGVKATAHQ